MAAQPVTPAEGLAGFNAVLATYEHRVGHVCRAVAGHLATMLTDHLPSATSSNTSPMLIHDNACGTGAVTDKFLQSHPHSKVHATDAVPPMIASFKSAMATQSKWQEAVLSVSVQDAQDLKFEDQTFDLSIMNFGIFFLPDPLKGAKEVYRTLQPGGVAVTTVWKEFGFKPVLWEVQDRIKPKDPLLELPGMERWTDGTLLKQTLTEAGFEDVTMEVVKEFMWGTDLADCMSVLLENMGAMVQRNWTEEEKSRLVGTTKEVLEEQGSKFLVRDGERVGLPMVCWVAICKKPVA